jgi:hypothetical protein
VTRPSLIWTRARSRRLLCVGTPSGRPWRAGPSSAERASCASPSASNRASHPDGFHFTHGRTLLATRAVSQEIPGTVEHVMHLQLFLACPSPHVAASAHLERELVPRVLGTRPAWLQQPYTRISGEPAACRRAS